MSPYPKPLQRRSHLTFGGRVAPNKRALSQSSTNKQQSSLRTLQTFHCLWIWDDIAVSKTQCSLRPAATDGINFGSGYCAMPTRQIHEVVNVVEPRTQMQPERPFKENLVQGSNTATFLMGATLSSHCVNVTLPLPDECSDS